MVQQFKEWFDMGGYGIYIWPCYLAFLIFLFAQIFMARRQFRKTLHKLQANVSNE